MQIKTAIGSEKLVGRFFLSGTQDKGGRSQRWLPEASGTDIGLSPIVTGKEDPGF